MRLVPLVGISLGLLFTGALGSAQPPARSSAAEPRAEDEALAVVERFHRALTEGDRAAVLEALSPDVVIFESGGAELSRDEYAAHHLGSDMEFAQATRTEVAKRLVHGAGDAAHVLTWSRTTGRFRDRDLDVATVETMLLRRAAGNWSIAHIHWSSRSQPRQ